MQRAQRRYEDRRERFSLTVFRTLIARTAAELTDYGALAHEAVHAADELDAVLYPRTTTPIVPAQSEPSVVSITVRTCPVRPS